MNEKKSVAFLIPELSPGGAQSHLIRDANGLYQRGYRVSVIVISDKSEMAGELDAGIYFHALCGRSSSIGTLRRFMAKIREIDADVVVGWSIFANLMVALAQAVGAVKKSILVENNYPPLAYRLMPPMRRLFIAMAARQIYRRATMIAGNSDEIVDYMRRWIGPEHRYARFYNPVNFGRLLEMSNDTVSLPATANEETIILMAGRIWEYQKGIDILLAACQRLLDHPKPWSLWVLGDGGDLQTVKDKSQAMGLSDRVAWLGMKRNPFPYFRRADIVVLPSRFEGFPNTLLEAMALGRATISSDCKSGPRELTQDGVFGILVPVGDDRALADAIAELIAHPDRRTELGNAAAKYVRETYSEEKVFSELARAIEGVA